MMIGFSSFTKRFAGHTAVSSLSLDVMPGEVVALLGPNGSGKTTTIKAAAGLVRPTDGEVTIGQPPLRASDPSARAAFAFLPQKVTFPELLTPRDVVTFYAALRGQHDPRIDHALEVTGLREAERRRVGTFSGGMTQRLGLAVAIAAEAPVLLLDEPTAALDPDGLRTFYSLIEHRRSNGQTVLFSSHQMGDVERLADRFAILVAGRLVATLTSRELSARLADRGVMKVSVDRPNPALLSAVQRIAPESAFAADQLVVPGPARIRPGVLDLVREAGTVIRGLTAEDGRLDSFYHELVGCVS